MPLQEPYIDPMGGGLSAGLSPPDLMDIEQPFPAPVPVPPMPPEAQGLGGGVPIDAGQGLAANVPQPQMQQPTTQDFSDIGSYEEKVPTWKKALGMLGAGLAGYGGTGPAYLKMLSEAKDDRRKDAFGKMLSTYRLLKSGRTQDARNYLADNMDGILADGVDASDSGKFGTDIMGNPTKALEAMQDTLLIGAAQYGYKLPANFGKDMRTTMQKNIAAATGYDSGPKFDAAMKKALKIAEGGPIDKKFIQDGMTIELQDDDTYKATPVEGLEVPEKKREKEEDWYQKRAATDFTRKMNTDAMTAAFNGVPALRKGLRAVQLLKEIKTGGLAAVKMRVRSFLGIEPANEAEFVYLTNEMILADLKANFGAAMATKEIDWKRRISAGEGKSIEANEAIMMQLINEGERLTRLGLAGARNLDMEDNIYIPQLEAVLGEIDAGRVKIPTVSTQAEIDKLSSGDSFIWTDGKTYEKG